MPRQRKQKKHGGTEAPRHEGEDAAKPIAPDYITPALHPLVVAIDSIRLDPRNARKHGDRNRRAIRHSLQTFGQQKPISVDADGIILAGNGTYAEAVGLGWQFIAIARSHLRGMEARAYALADNRTGELADWDVEELRATLDELQDENFDIDGLEINDEDIEKLERELTGERAEPAGKGGSGAGAGNSELNDQWKIVIDCADENDQANLLERFKSEGRKCRALTA